MADGLAGLPPVAAGPVPQTPPAKTASTPDFPPAAPPLGDRRVAHPVPDGAFHPVAATFGDGRPSGHAVGPGVSAATAKALASYAGATWAGVLDGNGGRETSLLVPPGLDPSQPVEVIVFIPGILGGDKNAASQALNGANHFKAAIDDLGKRRNAVIVLPTLAYTHDEFKPPAEDVGAFQDAAVAQIQRQFGLQTGLMTLVAYSYGGQPLMNAAESGRIKAGTRLLSLDSTYRWNAELDICRRLGTAAKAHGYPLHNFYHPGRQTLPVAAGEGTNHVLAGAHGTLPRNLAAVLQAAYPIGN